MAFICHSNACHWIFPRIDHIFAPQQAHALPFSIYVCQICFFFLTLHIPSTLITCSMIQWLMLCVFLLCNVFPFYLILSVIVTLTDTHIHTRTLIREMKLRAKKKDCQKTQQQEALIFIHVCMEGCVFAVNALWFWQTSTEREQKHLTCEISKWTNRSFALNITENFIFWK